MAKIKIVTDSSVTIEPEVVKDLDITIVTLSVMVDGVVYSDSDLKEGEFLRLMKESKNLPKTSQPPVGVFAEVFETLAENNINIQMISTSEIKISVLIQEEQLEKAVKALHTAFGLDREDGESKVAGL